MSDHPNPTPADATSSGTGIPVWFWIVSVLALLWNLMGLLMFGMDVTVSEETLAARYDEAELHWFATRVDSDKFGVLRSAETC